MDYSYPAVGGLEVNLSLASLRKNSFAVVSSAVILVALVYFYRQDPVRTQAVCSRTVREAAPLLLAALCGLIGERSGIVNIGIEGQITLAGFAAFFTAAGTGSVMLGAVVGIAAASLAGLFLAWCANALRMDHIIAGTVLNIAALSGTNFYYAQGKTMGSFPRMSIPLLEDLPLLGKALFQQSRMVYIAAVVVVIVHVALWHTRWGLRTRAIGEHPSAADNVGVRIIRLRYLNMAIAGAVAGLAALTILDQASSFSNTGFSAGKGFIALAVMLFGRYRPMGALLGAMVFGFFLAMQAQLQFDQTIDIPQQFIGMVPYLLTIAVLAVSGLTTSPPAALGQHYEKE